jgi:hypothetical protein
MKQLERQEARRLRAEGYSLKDITEKLGVAKSSVSLWVRDIELSDKQKEILREKGFYRKAVELRRTSRLANEAAKRNAVVLEAQAKIDRISRRELHLMGVMLYWAEGGKTQRMVRFSNGDPEMIKIMMVFFRKICDVPERKFRGYIHIHSTLDHVVAEKYWSSISGIPLSQFFKTYRKPNKSSQGKKNTLPYGVFDIYVLDTELFLKILGWAKGIFASY